MKKLIHALVSFLTCTLTAQNQMDSLQGFDLPATVMQAHQKNLHPEDMKVYLNAQKRIFLKEKYHLKETNYFESSDSKYNPGTIMTIPCFYEDFSWYSTGILQSTGWTVQQATLTGVSNFLCTNTTTFINNGNAVTVTTSPVTDPVCGNVPYSPFGGNFALVNNGSGLRVVKMRLMFPVTSSNWYYNYAYFGVMSNLFHGCCDDAFLAFNFYDCGGTYLSSLSHTIDAAATPSCNYGAALNWAPSTTTNISQNTGWQIMGQNLSAFIGSCVTVEVMAGSCSYSAHPAYMYYDALCSAGSGMIANGKDALIPSTSYTSCSNTSTLSGLSGFSSYLWQGPTSGTVSGLTSSVIVTDVPGTYTLTTTVGTIVTTQTLNLILDSSTLSISGNFTICQGETTTLQAVPVGVSSYTWGNTSTTQTISINPGSTTVYSIAGTTSLNCPVSDSKTVVVYQVPTSFVMNNQNPICPGQSVNISAQALGISTFTWNTGFVGSAFSATPSGSTVYIATGTTTDGCLTTASKSITVFPLLQVQLSANNTSLCPGQTSTLTVTASGTISTTYSWSTGSTGTSIVVTPTLSATYNVTTSTIYGCVKKDSIPITVFPLPQVQMIAPLNQVCIGQNAGFGITGNNISTVLWSNGANTPTINVSPTVNTVYTATVTGFGGCTISASASLNVNPLPLIQVIASSPTICVGESTTLTANSQAGNFSWSSNQSGSLIVVSPPATNQYTVTITDPKGCVASASLQVVVITCVDTNVTGLSKNDLDKSGFVIYPNPSDGTFEIRASVSGKGKIFNDLGQLIAEFYVGPDNNYTYKATILAKGVYFVSQGSVTEKVIVK